MDYCFYSLLALYCQARIMCLFGQYGQVLSDFTKSRAAISILLLGSETLITWLTLLKDQVTIRHCVPGFS